MRGWRGGRSILDTEFLLETIGSWNGGGGGNGFELSDV